VSFKMAVNLAAFIDRKEAKAGKGNAIPVTGRGGP
jgi:hypothetical protein